MDQTNKRRDIAWDLIAAVDALPNRVFDCNGNLIGEPESHHAPRDAGRTSGSLAERLEINATLGTTTRGTLVASMSTTESIVLTGGGTYILSATLFGANTDVHRTYIVNVPFTQNLNVDFLMLRGTSYNMGEIALQTQNMMAASDRYGYNESSNYTLKLTFTSGASPTSWSYSLTRLH